MNTKTVGLHIGGIKGNPVEVESLNVINRMLQEGVSRSSGHERIIDSDGQPRGRDPVDGKEEVQWLEAFDVEIKVYAAKLVENKVSDYVGALNLYSEARESVTWVGMQMDG